MHFNLVFSAKVCFKVVVRSVKIGEAIDFLSILSTVLNDIMSKALHITTM